MKNQPIKVNKYLNTFSYIKLFKYQINIKLKIKFKIMLLCKKEIKLD